MLHRSTADHVLSIVWIGTQVPAIPLSVKLTYAPIGDDISVRKMNDSVKSYYYNPSTTVVRITRLFRTSIGIGGSIRQIVFGEVCAIVNCNGKWRRTIAR